MFNRLFKLKHPWNIVLPLFIGISLIYLAFLKPGIWGIDGSESLWMARSLVMEQNFTLPDNADTGIRGVDGQIYSIRYPLLPVVASPFVAVGLFLAHLLNLPERYPAAVCALVVSILITAATAVMVALITLRLGGKARHAYLAALSFAFGSIALVYANQFFPDPLLGLITALVVYLALGETFRSHAIAGLLVGLAIVAKPAGIVVGPVVSVYFLLKKYPLPSILAPLLGSAYGFGLFLAYNIMRFGDPLRAGQNTSRFQWGGMLERLSGLILSPSAGGGLLWYCPPVFLALIAMRLLWKKQPKVALLFGALFVSYWGLYAFWDFSGWNWGPRLLFPTLPLLFALVGLLGDRYRGWLLSLTALGFLVNAPSLISYYQRYFAESADAGNLEYVTQLWGYPGYAPLFHAWPAAFRQLGDALVTDVRDILNSVGRAPFVGNLATSDLLNIVAVWWWVLPIAGIPLWLGFAIACIMLFLGVRILLAGWSFVSHLEEEG